MDVPRFELTMPMADAANREVKKLLKQACSKPTLITPDYCFALGSYSDHASTRKISSFNLALAVSMSKIQQDSREATQKSMECHRLARR